MKTQIKLLLSFWAEAVANNLELVGYTSRKLLFALTILVPADPEHRQALLNAAMEDLLYNAPHPRVKALRAIREYVSPSDEEIAEMQAEALRDMSPSDMYDA